MLEKCKYKRDLYSTRYCYFNDLWTTQRVYRCLKWDHVIPAQLTAFKNRKKMFLNIHSFAHICKRDYVSTYASGFIYPKIFDDCVVLLKTCYIVIVCHDLPSLQKCIMTVLIIRNQAWNENV